MNRNFTLILSAILVVVLLAIWIYLMFFANQNDAGQEPISESGEFANFDGLQGGNTGDSSVGGGVPGQVDSDGATQPLGGGGFGELPILRQLTTRNVIGYQEIEVASTTRIIFMESGVGHIYEIDLETGAETRVSATTIPDAREASFSKDGQFVVVKSGEDTGLNPLQLGTIDSDNRAVSLLNIAEIAGQIAFTETGDVLYTSVTNSGVVGNVFDVESQTSQVLFTTPFREAIILFGSETSASHYFFPKTSYLLEGFVYEVTGGNLNRLSLDGFGFVSELVGNRLVNSYRDQSSLVSSSYNIENEEVSELPITVIPEKCVSSNEKLLCAQPDNRKLQYNSINRWLQGVESYADSLWMIDEEPEILIDITGFSGREVDVINGLVGTLSGDWYFQNKKDSSLWIYELSRLPAEEVVVEENI